MGVAVVIAHCATAMRGAHELGLSAVLASILGAAILILFTPGNNRRAFAKRRSSSERVGSGVSHHNADTDRLISHRASTAADDRHWRSAPSSHWLHIALGALIIVAMVVLFLVSAALLLKSEPDSELRWSSRAIDDCTSGDCLHTAHRSQQDSLTLPLLRPQRPR